MNPWHCSCATSLLVSHLVKVCQHPLFQLLVALESRNLVLPFLAGRRAHPRAQLMAQGSTSNCLAKVHHIDLELHFGICLFGRREGTFFIFVHDVVMSPKLTRYRTFERKYWLTVQAARNRWAYRGCW